MLTYAITIARNLPDGGYVATCTGLDLTAFGPTEQAALYNLACLIADELEPEALKAKRITTWACIPTYDR